MKNKIILASIAIASLGALLLLSEASAATYTQQTSSTVPNYRICNCPMIPAGGTYEGSTNTPEDNASASAQVCPCPTGPLGYGTTTPIKTFPPITTQNQQGISINGQGNVQLSYGQVQAVNGNSLTVSVFGINFAVDTTNAKVGGGIALPANLSSLFSTLGVTTTPTTSSPTTINVGDRVTLSGTVASSTGVISATTIRDLTTQSQSSNTIQNTINELLQMVSQLRSQISQ